MTSKFNYTGGWRKDEGNIDNKKLKKGEGICGKKIMMFDFF